MTRYFFSILLLFIVFLAVNADSKIICDFCKKEITGQYVEAEGKYFHPGHFKCGKCGRDIGQASYFVDRGKPICENCYNRFVRPSCGYCKRPIQSNYIESNGIKYHPDCYKDHVALKCRICRKEISGQYIIDFWGNTYCQHHQDELPQCEYCGRLISKRTTGGGKKYSDGRHVCGYCLQNAVSDTRTAWNLLEETRLRLKSFGIDIDSKDISLTLTDRHSLGRLYGDGNANHTGFVKYRESLLNGIVGSRTFDIYILDGMPHYDFITAAAHELMHVWQYSNGITDNKRSFCEGSCNYAAYLVLNYYRDDYARYLIENMNKNPDPHYGEGYRRVSRLVKNRGIEGWLDDLKNRDGFPPGF